MERVLQRLAGQIGNLWEPKRPQHVQEAPQHPSEWPSKPGRFAFAFTGQPLSADRGTGLADNLHRSADFNLLTFRFEKVRQPAPIPRSVVGRLGIDLCVPLHGHTTKPHVSFPRHYGLDFPPLASLPLPGFSSTHTPPSHDLSHLILT